MPDEGKAVRRGCRAIFLQIETLFAPVSVEGHSTIQFATEALRTHPRRSEKVLEMYSPLILKPVSRSFDLHFFELRLWVQSLFRY
jgi:hypothetical protein